ncbi:SseB family protein [Mycobacterium sp. WMMD1722]|uniref:SseB family protein n=1 Tax=Mycobacterium sp. WMMD1722 TaxID=3404117 RepID=UPI003BF45ECB
MNPVDNDAVRRAVAAFAIRPEQSTALEVLRQCMFGELLLDVTGSDAPVGGSFRKGGTLRINGGTGPDGGRALFAFSRQSEIARMHDPAVQTQSLVTSSIGALEMVRREQGPWLYIDPVGPYIALSRAELGA